MSTVENTIATLARSIELSWELESKNNSTGQNEGGLINRKTPKDPLAECRFPKLVRSQVLDASIHPCCPHTKTS